VTEFCYLDFTLHDWAFFQQLFLFLGEVKKFKLKYLGLKLKKKGQKKERKSRDIWKKA
jgi:hypothetical protein